jgi:hypothetical protein
MKVGCRVNNFIKQVIRLGSTLFPIKAPAEMLGLFYRYRGFFAWLIGVVSVN